MSERAGRIRSDEFRDAVLELLDENGMSQRELAEELDIPWGTFNRYMTGDHSVPIGVVRSIGEYFETNIFIGIVERALGN